MTEQLGLPGLDLVALNPAAASALAVLCVHVDTKGYQCLSWRRGSSDFCVFHHDEATRDRFPAERTGTCPKEGAAQLPQIKRMTDHCRRTRHYYCRPRYLAHDEAKRVAVATCDCVCHERDGRA